MATLQFTSCGHSLGKFFLVFFSAEITPRRRAIYKIVARVPAWQKPNTAIYTKSYVARVFSINIAGQSIFVLAFLLFFYHFVDCFLSPLEIGFGWPWSDDLITMQAI
jgi:hypothetical protein